MTSQQVIRSYLSIAGLYTFAASIIWGVNTLFLLDAGLSIEQVFIANTGYTIGTLFFEIPTGVVADTTGRRMSFLLSLVTLFITTLAYVYVGENGGGVVLVTFISIFLGLGFTFYSGAVEAWLVDALDATGYEGELDRVFARGSMVTGAAMLVGSVGGGIIGTIDLVFPYVVRAGLLAILFIIAYANMHDLGYESKPLKLNRIPAEMRQLAGASIRFGWQESHIRLLMLVSFLQAGFMMWAFYAWQPYFLDLLGEPDAIWIAGIITALLSIATIIGNAFTEWETHRSGRRTNLMIGSLAVFGICMMGVGLTNSFWIAVPLFLIAMGTTGVTMPIRQSYIHHLIPSEQRATVLSVDSMFSSGGGIISQLSLGRLAQQVGIAEGYIVGGGVSLLGLPLLFMLRNLGGEADIIIGDAGHSGGQAAHGIPEISQVDCNPHHIPESATASD